MEYLEGTMWITRGDPAVKAHLEQQNRYSTQGNNLRHLIQLYEHTEKENIYVKCVDKETVYLIDTSIYRPFLNTTVYHYYEEKSSIHCLDKETKYAGLIETKPYLFWRERKQFVSNCECNVWHT
jgi:hypothetical protein